MTATLDHLFDNNVAWVDRRTRDDPGYFRRMAEQQTPRYLWIGCSDSRVTANDVLGLEPGEVFVQRNVANMVHSSDLNLLTVVEYAVSILGIRHLIVCGHYGCGGIRHVLSGSGGRLADHWLQPVAMFHRRHRAVLDSLDETQRLNRLCEINVEMQVRRLAATPTVEAAWLSGVPLHVHGWIYCIEDGLLRDLGPHLSSLEQRDALPPIDATVAEPREPASGLRRQALAAFSGPSEECGCPCGNGAGGSTLTPVREED